MTDEHAIRGAFSQEKLGGMRAIIFSTFYEELLREYLTRNRYEVCSGKPQIFWKQVAVPSEFRSENHRKLVSALKKKQIENVYGVPDGLLIRQGRHLVWEAKNWIQELFPSPFSQKVWEFPWLLAKQVTYRGQEIAISGFLISWWEPEEGIGEVLEEVRGCISPLTLDIFYTADVLQECCEARYQWYLDILSKKRTNIDEFFRTLMGHAESRVSNENKGDEQWS